MELFEFITPRRGRERGVTLPDVERGRLVRARQRVEVAANDAALEVVAHPREFVGGGDVRAPRAIQRLSLSLRAQQQVVASLVHAVLFGEPDGSRLVHHLLAVHLELLDDELHGDGVQRREGHVQGTALARATLDVVQEHVEHVRVCVRRVTHRHQIHVIAEMLKRAKEQLRVVAVVKLLQTRRVRRRRRRLGVALRLLRGGQFSRGVGPVRVRALIPPAAAAPSAPSAESPTAVAMIRALLHRSSSLQRGARARHRPPLRVLLREFLQ